MRSPRSMVDGRAWFVFFTQLRAKVHKKNDKRFGFDPCRAVKMARPPVNGRKERVGSAPRCPHYKIRLRRREKGTQTVEKAVDRECFCTCPMHFFFFSAGCIWQRTRAVVRKQKKRRQHLPWKKQARLETQTTFVSFLPALMTGVKKRRKFREPVSPCILDTAPVFLL